MDGTLRRGRGREGMEGSGRREVRIGTARQAVMSLPMRLLFLFLPVVLCGVGVLVAGEEEKR